MPFDIFYLFLLGDFDVELSGTGAVIKEAGKRIETGDITRQGMPFYTRNLEYSFSFLVEAEVTDYTVHVPCFKAPVLAVFLDGLLPAAVGWNHGGGGIVLIVLKQG